jgi:quercetin 2,3-dioxygenase
MTIKTAESWMLRFPSNRAAAERSDEQFELTEGDTILLPRGVPHTFCQLGDSGRLRFLYTPAGAMEDFFRALAQLPGPPAPEVGAALFAAHGMQVVGPPLTPG